MRSTALLSLVAGAAGVLASGLGSGCVGSPAPPAETAPGASGASGAPGASGASGASGTSGARGPAPVASERPTPKLASIRPGDPLPDFALLDQDGGYHALYEQDDVRFAALVSFDPDCPTSRAEAAGVAELARLEDEVQERVRVLYLDADPTDTRAELRTAREELGVAAPVLHDTARLVAHRLGFERTGEAIVADTRDWRAAWRGAVAELSDALDALRDGRRAPEGRAPSAGTPIAYPHRADPVPDFARDVAPILERRCLECHTHDGIAPWAMSSFERVRGWSPMIRETVLTRRMPPWQADSCTQDDETGSAAFVNDRSLRADEARTLLAWIDAGTPRGEGEDPLPALEAREVPEWELGEPDVLVDTVDVPIEAHGIIPYRWWQAEIDNTEDLWVRAAIVKPSNRRVMHHAQVFIVYPEELSDEQPKIGAEHAFAWYVPGVEPLVFPERTGKRIPPGSKIIFQLHYTSTGKPEVDHPRLALYLCDDPPVFEYESDGPVGWEIRLPPYEPHYEHTATLELERDVVLCELSPHMHYRGKAMTYRAEYPDGRSEVLLSVPRYDFNWQLLYRLAEPRLLPRGTKVVCTAVFDNSPRNPFNPDPSKEVVWGNQSTDEMMIGTLGLYAADGIAGGERE